MSEQGWLIILLVVCTLVCTTVCDATIEQKSMPGGLTRVRPADEGVQAIADEVNTLCVDA